MVRILLFIFTFLHLVVSAQDEPFSIGDLQVDFKQPKKYELGPIRVDGADNFDHQAIKLIAGLKQGQQITIPGEQIAKAIRNLWNEGIFSDVEIFAEKELAGVIYLVIKVSPRPKLSRFKFKGIHFTNLLNECSSKVYMLVSLHV